MESEHESLLKANLDIEFIIATLACIGDGVIATSLDGKILFMNNVAEELIGCKFADAKGKNFNEVFPIVNTNTRTPIESPVIRAINAGAAIGLKKHSGLVSKDGSIRYISASCSPIKALDGNIKGAVVVFRDVTLHKSFEMKIAESKDAAEAANRAKSEFLANMSHEIRTPLNGIVGMIDLTLLSDLSFEQKDNLIMAKACANSLLKIINDILDFSKMEAGKLVIESTNFDIKELVEETVKVHSSRATGKGLELNYTFSSTIPQYLAGDPNRLQQVLNNLISNAIKFTEKGDITISVKKNAVNMAVRNDEVELRFAVSDTGIGIAPEEMDRLFKSFSQVDSSFTRKFGGTGLGLVISRQLAQMMGGTMWVESEKDRGSTFYFTIRCKLGSQAEEKLKEQMKIFKANDALHILLVEDDKVNQMVITRMLKEKGYSTEIASNGAEAVTMYQQGKYDAILMDIQMPEMDGIEATKRIREKEIGSSYNHIPIIAQTAYALQGDRERFLSMGMDEYIAKPISMCELFYALDRVSAIKCNREYNEVRLGENGEIQFAECKKADLIKEQIPVLAEISGCIKELIDVLADNNLSAMEKIAHRIKSHANQIDVGELKSAAFKIELAARRGNLKEAIEASMQIRHEFEVLTNEHVNRGGK